MSVISKWKDKITHYVDIRLQLMKLTFVERTSNVLGYFIFTFIGLFLSLAILIFLGVGLGEYFASLVDSRAGGYFMTAGVYVLLVVVMFLLRKNIVDGFAGIFIRILTEGDDDDDEETKKIKVE